MTFLDTQLIYLPFSVDWDRVEDRARVVAVVTAALTCPPSAVVAHCQTLAVMAPLVGDEGTEGREANLEGTGGWEANLEWLKLTNKAVGSGPS